MGNGLVALVGRPSAGKSTFINTACQGQVSITSPTPQTTRNAIRGIVNTSLGQLVLVDTPGIHISNKKFNIALTGVAKSALEGADAALYIIDATREVGAEEEEVAQLLLKSGLSVIAALNKCDLLTSGEGYLIEATVQWVKQYFSKVFLMSAKNDEGVNEVLKALYDALPEQEPLYSEELYTDQDITFRVSEVIRGEAIKRLTKELPHCIRVDIADIEARGEGKRLWVRAFLCVETDTQKAIVIGHGATMIKAIRLGALKTLKGIFRGSYKFDLDLQVKVDKGWRAKDSVIKKVTANG